MNIATRQIRASYDDRTIRIYQAYSNNIADSALANGNFITPPFKMERMTWIKPSFLWMMYRSGWGRKDCNQERILAIDITLEGFQWCLNNSWSSHFNPKEYPSREIWQEEKKTKNVIIQWDPERDLYSNPLEHRAIQIGIKGDAVNKYVNEWIIQITDMTPTAREIESLLINGCLENATALLPVEKEFVQKLV